MPNKIAYVVSRFPSFYETFIMREMSVITERGFDIKIFSLKNPQLNRMHKETVSLMDRVYYSPYFFSFQLVRSQFYFLFRRPVTYLYLLFYIIRHSYADMATLLKSLLVFPKSVHYAKVIRENKITHVHAHWATIPTLSALVISRLIEVPFSVTAHAIDIFQNTTMLEEKLSQAKFIVTCAKYNKTYLVNNFKKINPEKIFLNYHGIDLRRFTKRSSCNLNAGVILSVGRLEESKGYKYLLEACARLMAEKVPFKCTIIGDGPLRSFIEVMIKKLGLTGCVSIMGALPQDEVINHYERSDIFVLPAVSQFHWGIPNVLIEAMAVELPVITTPLPAMAELIQSGENGLIVPEKDSGALAEAIHELLGSEELKIRLAKNGRSTVERVFNNQETISELVSIYESCIQAR